MQEPNRTPLTKYEDSGSVHVTLILNHQKLLSFLHTPMSRDLNRWKVRKKYNHITTNYQKFRFHIAVIAGESHQRMNTATSQRRSPHLA